MTPPRTRPATATRVSLLPRTARWIIPETPKTEPLRIIRLCTDSARPNPPRKEVDGVGVDIAAVVQEKRSLKSFQVSDLACGLKARCMNRNYRDSVDSFLRSEKIKEHTSDSRACPSFQKQ